MTLWQVGDRALCNAPSSDLIPLPHPTYVISKGFEREENYSSDEVHSLSLLWVCTLPKYADVYAVCDFVL